DRIGTCLRTRLAVSRETPLAGAPLALLHSDRGENMQLLKKPTLKEKYHTIGRLFRNYYFRAQLVDRSGAAEQPSNENPVIFASNHSGMNFPWDNIMLYQSLKEHYGEKFKLEAIATPVLF